jgi:superfamily II DNA helicase RecQ
MRFFQIPVRAPAEFEAELNGFLGRHRVTRVERHFVDARENSFWAICVEWTHGGGGPGDSAPGKERAGQVDYKEVLTPEQFEHFAKLRELRKKVAGDEAVPVYAVFTNEHLAAMVRRGVRSEAGLRGIDGVGEARVKKYGAAFLSLLNEQPKGAVP